MKNIVANLNIDLLYTMAVKFLRKPKILLFLPIIFFSSCQLTTSGVENKSLIKEDVSESALNNEKKIAEKKDISKNNEDEIKKKTLKENKENKRILDFFTDLFDPESEEKSNLTKESQQQKKKKLKTSAKELENNKKKK